VGTDVVNQISAIATDMDAAFIGPIKDLLPQSHHILCRWHIEKNIIKNTTPHLGNITLLYY
jgi:hypothetical protein